MVKFEPGNILEKIHKDKFPFIRKYCKIIGKTKNHYKVIYNNNLNFNSITLQIVDASCNFIESYYTSYKEILNGLYYRD